MKFKQGDKVRVIHDWLGRFNATAVFPSDTEVDVACTLRIDQSETIVGRSQDWHRGDEMLCSLELCDVQPRKGRGNGKKSRK